RGGHRRFQVRLIVFAEELELPAGHAAGGVDLLGHPLHRLAHRRPVVAAGAGERRQRAEPNRGALRANDRWGRANARERGGSNEEATTGYAARGDHGPLPPVGADSRAAGRGVSTARHYVGTWTGAPRKMRRTSGS